MSFTIPPQAPARPNRCQLFGPGSRPELFEKMAASAADVINLDLEDSVSPGDKEAARANVILAINEIDWGRKTLSVRINGLDSGFWYRDVVDLLEQAGDRIDLIMIPKCGNARDIYAVDALVSSVEMAKGRKKRVGFEALIETAPGFAHVEEIAAASPRLQSMSLGAADFAASMGMQTTGIGGTQENYYMLPPVGAEPRLPVYADPWHGVHRGDRRGLPHARRCCRSTGRSATSPTTPGFRAQARRAATLGMVGKWAIHPKQVALANEVFTPSEKAVTEAREILAAMAKAETEGQGAAVYKGRLVDLASIRQAQVIVRQAEIIAG